MFAALLGTLIDSVVKAAFNYFAATMEKRGLVQQGQVAQAAADVASAEATQAAIAKAEANAPQTKDAVLDALRTGNA